MVAQGYFQCNPRLSSYDAVNCLPVLVSGINKLGTDLWLDSTTDIDDPIASKTVDSNLCLNSSNENYPVVASVQGINGITPDLYDFYGQRLTFDATEWDFFVLSKDRAPFCPDAAWLSVDPQSCAENGYTQIVLSSSSEAS